MRELCGICNTLSSDNFFFALIHPTLSPAAGAAGTWLVGIREADAGRQRRLVGHLFFLFVTVGHRGIPQTATRLLVDRTPGQPAIAQRNKSDTTLKRNVRHRNILHRPVGFLPVVVAPPMDCIEIVSFVYPVAWY